ncbi:methyltransferase [Sphaerisporangium sp. TRM90804]|uniref:methyltransferase n=1 Tax=Sphaerisporangium sp. TRM90804 TaxID=3031113 RepID=UPI0024472912|nr:methyltransferase [Sphaerisporangium sp. TRM90804]MDH2430082.1 methyltransferase [Sphaerisporangium sp. TRM90804]
MTDPASVIWDVLRGSWRTAAMRSMVELDCAEHLADGPLSVAELAARCDAHAPSLSRLMRTLASVGLVETVGEDSYALTEAGAMLRADAPLSLRSGVLFNTDPLLAPALAQLTKTVRTGRSAWVEDNGHLYDYMPHHPELAQLFNNYMTNRAVPMAEGVASRYDFGSMREVVDVGGGRGHILAAVLRANPELRGVLLELPHVLADAREAFASWGLSDRCEFVEGDFFASVPEGADAYLLGSVVHNWDEASALTILSVVRAAVPREGRVLLVEMVLPDDDRPHFGKDLDMRMLSLFGQGRERSRSEYTVLLEKAGLTVTGVTPLPFNASLVEARPA